MRTQTPSPRSNSGQSIFGQSISAAPRVLVAEDYIPNAEFIAAALEFEGYEADLAANGVIAVDLAMSTPYDAILMDIEMPEMDGIRATQMIRRHEQATGAAPAPIIGITGHTMTSIRLLCLRAGMNELLVKPFLPSVLYSRIEAWLAPRAALRPAAESA